MPIAQPGLPRLIGRGIGDNGKTGRTLDGPRTVRFAANETIHRAGETPDNVHLIQSGMAKVVSHLPSGQARIVRLHGTGHWLGLEGLLRQPCGHAVIAVRELEAYRFPVDGFPGHPGQDYGPAGPLARQWHSDLRQAEKWISEFSTGGIPRRVACLLAYLAELEHGDGACTVELLTVSEMAEILGVTQESVSRVLAAFKRRGVLERPAGAPRDTFRLDYARLRQQAVLSTSDPVEF
ncbi:MAG TPA: Crp/Fnr family transcriptional regulator [Arenicellales bacterium]|nr:Crp/Fnr family transcriptional regulator [Arenicellales bacterium]